MKEHRDDGVVIHQKGSVSIGRTEYLWRIERNQTEMTSNYDPVTRAVLEVWDYTSNLSKYALEDERIEEAIKKVRSNKGAPGIDGMKVDDLEEYFHDHLDEIRESIWNRKYKPQPVRRVYIPKPNGDKRPLGIPVAVDRVIQQAFATALSNVFEPEFSEHSYGFRPGKSAAMAIEQAVEYLNEGYEWIIDLDIQKFFDTVNHDKLISLIRKRVPEDITLSMIRKFLKAGYMENGVFVKSELGQPQGGCISPILSNIYLNELDQELNKRGIKWVRYADDAMLFAKSEKAADRIMNSISRWIEKHLFLKVSPTKTKVVRPNKAKFLGFTFYQSRGEGKWYACPHADSKANIYRKLKKILCRRKAASKKLNDVFWLIHLTVVGWINYYRIGHIKKFCRRLGEWLRHKVRVVILKQWKCRKTIFKNLRKINRNLDSFRKIVKSELGIDWHPRRQSEEYIFAQCYTRAGWYRLGNNQIVNNLLHPYILQLKTKHRMGLINPSDYLEEALARGNNC